MILFWLFVLSVPIFYIYGVISFIAQFFKQKKDSVNLESEAITYLKTAINELTLILKESPKKTVEQLLTEYKTQLKNFSSGEQQIGEEASEATTTPAVKAEGKASEVDVEKLWSNWYSNNSINLLLYIGAFLIVASASIFVGFQWQSIPGILKAGLLTLVAIVFFSFGIGFYSIPKIKNAGATFIGIGALLVPVCGAAWYNFVFKAIDPHPGPVWLVTSVVALTLYIFLAFNYKNKFYTYVASISCLSASVSLVNTLGFSSTFYILASMFTSFILLITSFELKKQADDYEEFAGIPIEITANIMMPATLIYGLIIASGTNRIFTMEVFLSLLLASAFYLFTYFKERKSWAIAAAQILFSFSIFIFFKWQNIETTTLLYGLTAVSFAYFYAAFFWKRAKLTEEQDVSIVIGFMQLILILIFSFTREVDWINRVIFAFTPVIAGFFTAYVKEKITYIGISTIFFAITLYLFHYHILNLNSHPEYLGLMYLVMGVGNYFVAVYYRKHQEALEAFGVSVIFYFLLSFIFTYSHSEYIIITNLTIASVAVFAALQFSFPKLIYISNIFFSIALLAILKKIGVQFELYPLFYSGLSFVYYFASFFAPKDYMETYRTSAFTTAIVNTLFFGFTGISTHRYKELESYALISSYAAIVLFGLETYLRKPPGFGYATSAVGMFTYLWQIYYLGVTEALIYSAPLGLYFMVLAYLRKLKHDDSGRELLDLIGLFFLLIPVFFLSFGEESMKYSIVLGIEGIALLIGGISLSYKQYKYAGIFGIVAAILPQTYSYILALPRWLVVGIFGFIFISVAMFLLLSRKEAPENSS